ncbi:hypothetical protein ACQJBY_054146 [Aegilops geniculata]
MVLCRCPSHLHGVAPGILRAATTCWFGRLSSTSRARRAAANCWVDRLSSASRSRRAAALCSSQQWQGNSRGAALSSRAKLAQLKLGRREIRCGPSRFGWASSNGASTRPSPCRFGISTGLLQSPRSELL